MGYDSRKARKTVIEKIMKIVILTSKSLILIYLLLSLGLYIFQRDLLYHPSVKIDHSYQEQTFYNDKESIKVLALNQGQKNSIILFGGNAQIIANRAPSYIETFPNHTIYLVNYRGYGGSSGMPEEQGLYSDALHIYDKIKAKHNAVSVIGRSLGTGVASYVASKRDITKLVLITPYDSIENIAKFRYPIFPISFILEDKFNSVGRVNTIKANTLIILAENDKIIPLENSQRLINQFPASQVTVATINNTNHITLSDTTKFYTLLQQFLR